MFFLSACPSHYVARHRKPRRCVYVLTLGGTGIRPPDSFSYRSNFRFHSSFRSRSSFSSTTSGDIFYCSGSRQLNHSSFVVVVVSVIVVVVVAEVSLLTAAASVMMINSNLGPQSPHLKERSQVK